VREREGERGFTVIELMVVVALIAILAAVALPTFLRTGSTTKGNSEIAIMFAELREKMERFKADNVDNALAPIGTYLNAGTCPAAPAFPAADASPCIALGTPWEKMKVQLVRKMLQCSYQITAGLKGVPPAPPAPFTMPTPAVSWYYIVATCNFNEDAAFSTYFVNSVDGKIQSVNEGS
jgi:type IV pilus assembly protein PilE